MSAQLDMIWPPLTALALYRASGPSLSSGMGYTKTPFLTKFLETVTYAPFCALFAAGDLVLPPFLYMGWHHGWQQPSWITRFTATPLKKKSVMSW